tara:strand:- start:48 stop:260 length:213 start_codon:yes stop_codon:yes gene_type:complete
MVVDQDICQALNRIADNQEEMNETLKAILGHYNSVVPVMTRNAKRAEEMADEHEKGFAQQVKNIFRPVEN